MATANSIKATARPQGGKGAARAERRAGRVPGVVYGDGKPPLNISLDFKDLRQRIYAGHFLSTIFDVELDGATHRVIPRDFQLDPIKDLPIHVDFLRLGVGARIRVNIPVHTINADASPGIKRGGMVNIVQHAIPVSCLADAIPPALEIDLTGLEIHHSVHLNDIQLPEGVRALVAADTTLVTIVPTSGFVEEQKAAQEAAVAAAGAAAEAAEAGPVATGAPAAPGSAPAAAAGAAGKPAAAGAAKPAAGKPAAGGGKSDKK